ncbi:MAG: CHAP domain-containing protein [Pseudanabaenaceae cyanobacterium]|jgi:surface antigen
MITATNQTIDFLLESTQAGQFCQCVRYVKNVLGISQPMGNAKDMIYSLPQHGFCQVSDPQSGDIVVMDSTFPGSDRTYGHVGFVDSIQNGRVVVRGANQGRAQYSDAGCRNVSVIRFRAPIDGRSDISFWRR